MMPRRPFVRAVSTLLALCALGAVAAAPAPAHADEKKQVYVKPSDMAAATAAREKGVAARKLLKEGKHAEGVKMLDEAVGELERTTGPDSDFSRVNRDVVVSVYKSLKQPEKAEAALKRAETARKTWKAPVSEPANANTASAMKKMAAGLEALKANDFPRAAELLEQAMPDLAKSDVGGQTYLLIAGVLASLYDYSQQFTKGEALRKDVIAKMEKSLGEDNLDVAEQYQSLATHYIMRLETPKAIVAQKKSVEITRRKAPGSTLLGDRLLQLANLQVETGNYDVAEPTISEAMLVVRGLSPVDPLRMVRIAELMVTLADAEMKFKEGDQAAEMTCKIAQTSGKAEVLEEAEDECIRTAIARGDTKAAGELAGARFARVEKRYGKSGPFFAHAAHELAIVRWVEGRKDEATSLAKRGADAQEGHLVRLLNASGDSQKRAQIGMLTVQQNDLLTMGGAGIDGGTPQVRLALETILRRKGRSLDASADAARTVRLFKGSTERGLASRQVEVRRQIAALGLRGGGGGGGGGRLVDPVALLARLEAEDDDISNKLAAASPLYRAQSRPVTIEAVQATIPDDAALLEYVFYQPRDTSSARFAPKGINFVAFVLHKTGEPAVVDLGSALPIDSSVEELRKALSSRGDVLPNAKRVHDLVFAPLKKHLRPTDTRLIVSPDEDLNLVPYAALVDDRGRFLVQDYDISYVTSGRDLLRIAALGSQTAASSRPVVLGNPSFDIAGTGTGAADASKTGTTTATRGDLDNARFPALPGTAVEVKAIADMLAASAFTADDATKSKLAGVTSPIVLHVATHGFFLAKQKDPGGANTRALEYDPGSTVTVPQRTENPLVRSGLALAGANKKGSADGLLTALEASSMSLDGTRLVVLSACETGVGQSEVGDGVYGLRRALVVAGSETQVMSLWKVDDDATRDLMIAYYKDLKGGAGRSAALRKVQLGMLSSKTTQHPYFWAAFIPSGAWGPMGFALDAPTATPESRSPVAKDRPSESRSHDDGYKRKGSAGFVALGAHYATLTNLRDQPDRTGVMLGFTLEHSLLGEHLAKENGLALHDAVNLAVYAGARTSDGTKYVDAQEGDFAAALRAGYEMALGVRGNAFSLYGGMQALYTSLIIGDARSFGLTLPLVGLFDFRVGKTFVGLRGTYGKFIVDQETVGGSLSINWDDVFLLGGIEQLKMPATVSLDGKEDRTTAGNQVSTIGTVAIGGRF